MDEAIESHDLIDLAALRLSSPIPPLALSKADSAYPVIEPLKKSILKLRRSEGYRTKCFNELEINNRPMILNGLGLLAQDFDLPNEYSPLKFAIEAAKRFWVGIFAN